MLLILETILETGGVIDDIAVRKFAKKLLYWSNHGFPELGDWGGLGLGMTTHAILSSGGFLGDPHGTAQKIWDRMGRNAAPNGGVMRTSITGCYNFKDINAVINNTVAFCKVTHYDERCVASCVATCVAIALMLQGKHELANGDFDVAKITEEACDHALKFMQPENHATFLKHIRATLEELDLDEHKAIGYTLKCVGSGFWSFRSDKGFKQTLYEVIKEGGDADTNGAVCGALLGARLGYSKLPKEWLASLRHKKWLDKKVIAFLKLNGL